MFNWNNLPNDDEIRAAVREISKREGQSPCPTLYHFSLIVLKTIYHLLEPSVSDPPPAPRTVESQSSLRAIAYFSWEKERHTFLIRRVYPVSFDFLSYSHVPDGWGALGIMLEKFANEESRAYTSIADIKESIRLLPYLRESERLGYESALVVPVLHNAVLLGSFVFYLRNKESIPTIDQEGLLIPKFEALSSEMAKAVFEHLQIISDGIGYLPNIWRRHSSTADGRMFELRICIESPAISSDDGLARISDDIAGSILSALNTEDTFTILDSSDESQAPNVIVFLVIGKIPPPILKRQILSAVGIAIGDSCPKNENRYFRFTCNPVEANLLAK